MSKQVDELLEELWDYGFESNGDFPTEHKGKYPRVAEIKTQLESHYKQEMLDMVGEGEECTELCEDIAICHHYYQNKSVYELRNKINERYK